MNADLHDLHDLAGPYALDALDGAEHAAFEAHLDACLACQAELARFRPAVSALAAVTAEHPPIDLRDRVLAAVLAEPDDGPAPGSAGATPLRTGDRVGTGRVPLDGPVGPRPVADEGRPRRAGPPARRSVPPWLAAVAAAVVLALLAWAAVGRLTGPSPETAGPDVEAVLHDPGAVTVPLQGSPGGSARVVWSTDRQRAVVDADGVPAPADGHVYEVWFIDGGRPLPGPSLTTLDGPQAIAVPPSMPEAVAITVEPAPGTLAPTGPIVLQGTRPA